MSSRRRTWDPTIRAQVVATGNVDLFPELDIPQSTIATWMRRGKPDVAWLHDDAAVAAKLRARVTHLEVRVKMLTALVRLVLTIMRIWDARIEGNWILDAKSKSDILTAVRRAAKAWPLRSVLKVLGMAPSRYHQWGRLEAVC